MALMNEAWTRALQYARGFLWSRLPACSGFGDLGEKCPRALDGVATLGVGGFAAIELIEELGGGAANGGPLKAAPPGGGPAPL